jgi:hypothetical protein
MKCDKCNYVSFDYNKICPKCSTDLTGIRDGLGTLYLAPPEAGLAEWFAEQPEARAVPGESNVILSDNTAELVIDQDDLEFTLDDELKTDTDTFEFNLDD